MQELPAGEKWESADLKYFLAAANTPDEVIKCAAGALDQVLAELLPDDGLRLLSDFLGKLEGVFPRQGHIPVCIWDALRRADMGKWHTIISDHNRAATKGVSQRTEATIETYCKASWFFLWLRHWNPKSDDKQLHKSAKDQEQTHYGLFLKDWNDHFAGSSKATPVAVGWKDPEHCYACLNQLRRACLAISKLTGDSRVMQKLRKEVWEVVFTTDFSYYQRELTGLVHRIPVLLIGETGSGKTLTAKLIADSSFVPFEEVVRNGLNLDQKLPYRHFVVAEHPKDLVESALFGHDKGAFTGAVKDRKGAFEECKEPWATIFLDEIGDLPSTAQVSLLKVLQNRCFYRVGGQSPEIYFQGRVVTATNVELEKKCAKGDFRRDLYFRLKGCIVELPTVKAQLLGQAAGEHRDAEFKRLWKDAARSLFLEKAQGQVTEEMANKENERRLTKLSRDFLEPWLKANPGMSNGGYDWPGNFRELQQCANSLLITRRYNPTSKLLAANSQSEVIEKATGESDDEFMHFSALFKKGWDHAKFLSEYGKAAVKHFPNIKEATRSLKVDARTLKGWSKPKSSEATPQV